ncbi:type II toxin-antitoxin system antitoxin SocA domain-containing protein [Gammaproteobacteria bacterium AS21]
MSNTSEYDVASYILAKQGEMTAMKLQKLLYYSQVWSMVWDEEELFKADFEAWANGPVLPTIYQVHRGIFKVNTELFKAKGNAGKITGDAADTVDQVLNVYGTKTAQWLSNLTHEEDPWLDARNGIPATQSSNVIIQKGDIHSYYSGL